MSHTHVAAALVLLTSACFADPEPSANAGTTGSGDTAGESSGSAAPATQPEETTTDGGSVGGTDSDGGIGTTTGSADGTTAAEDETTAESSETGPDPVCGNEIVEEGEDCDDGNAFNDDGCELDCTISPGTAQIEGGVVHTCARHWDGSVRCWGANGNAQLGVGNFNPIGDDEPPAAGVNVALATDAVHIGVGADFACALTTEETVRCWGGNTVGQLGYGHTDAIGDDELVFVAGDVDVGGAVVGLSVGGQSACAILRGGSLVCWGRNDEGQLGYGHLDTIGDDEPPSSAGVVALAGPVAAVAVELRHTCARLESGAVTCWGLGTSGQLGYGDTDSVGDDEDPVSAGEVLMGGAAELVAVGNSSSCARINGDELRCWGASGQGQLGHGNTDSIGDGELPATAGSVPVGGPVSDFSLGSSHVCALIDSDIRCWGYNWAGQLGLGHTESIGDDEPASDAPLVELGGDVLSVSTGADHTCARMAGGGVRCWGRNNAGQLGLGHTQTIGDDESPSSVGEINVGW